MGWEGEAGMVFAVAQPRLEREGRQAGAGPASGFALMGADFLLTSNLTPVLLEINSLPSLARKVGPPFLSLRLPSCYPPSSWHPRPPPRRAPLQKLAAHTSLGWCRLPSVLMYFLRSRH